MRDNDTPPGTDDDALLWAGNDTPLGRDDDLDPAP